MQSFIISSLVLFSIFTTPIAQTDPVNAVRIYDSASESLKEIKTQREEHVESLEETRRERILRRSEMLTERKRAIVNNLANRFMNVKTKWSNHWENVLTRLEKILAKIETRAIELEYDIDTSVAEEALTDAKTALSDLSSKEYLFEIDDEATLGENVRSSITVFKSDLTNTREAVFEAKRAVQAVFADLRSQQGNITENEE